MRIGALTAGVGLVLIIMLAAISIGPVVTSPSHTIDALASLFTGEGGASSALITQIRLPRVLVAALVGGALSVAGAAMQAIFRNPLAEPGITGVGAGAATFAVMAIITGLSQVHPLLLPGGAFIGALLATVVVQIAGGRRLGTSSATLLLVGIALNSFLGGLIGAMIANAPDSEDARSAVFWLNGDLTGRTMNDVSLIVLPIILGTAVILIHSRELNLLSLGEATAQSSGVPVKRVSHIVLAFAALATAGAVATTGVISFVGLVVPHMIRLVVGANHRFLLPASFIFGAAFLIVADTGARMLFNPVTLQTGVITALIGAPFLLVLVMRSRNIS